MKNILIIGATSAIAQETAKLYAAQGHRFFLVARNPNKLSIITDDLYTRGASNVESAILDLNQTDQHKALIQQSLKHLNTLDIILIAHGTLPNQTELQNSYEKTLECIQSNALSVISLLTILANILETQKHGCVAILSSVAGDRGRQSNYIYGSAKAMVSVFTEGLRNRLFKHGIHLVTLKPGFVDTPMTAEFPKGPLWAKPQAIAKIIEKSINQKQNIVYAPFFWRFIMIIIKSIPEFIFKRLSL